MDRANLSNSAFRTVSLDAAVAPTLASPVAPFAKSERKKALTSALYYSECFLRGIKPVDADLAACDAETRHKKWWVRACYQNNEEEKVSSKRVSEGPPIQVEGDVKRRKLESGYMTVTAAQPLTATISSAVKLDPVASQTTPTTQPLRKESSTSSLHILSEEEASSCKGHNRQGRDTEAETESDIAPIRQISFLAKHSHEDIINVKKKLIENLESTGGDTCDKGFLDYLGVLQSYYNSCGWDARCTNDNGLASDRSKLPPSSLDGTWSTLSKPTFSECLGRNKNGEYMYTLGRMSFDMYRPNNLRCSIAGIYNNINLMDKSGSRTAPFPRKLLKQMSRGKSNPEVRHYDLVVSFNILENQSRSGIQVDDNDAACDEFVLRRSIQGSMINQGYFVPDPDVPNRLTVWFCGGTLQVDKTADLDTWKELFDESLVPRRSIMSSAQLLAAKLLLGAYIPDKLKDDGSMRYLFKRPIGGHGQVFCDVLYLDETLRIMRGHQGSIFVHNRVSSFTDDDDSKICG